MQAHVLQTLPQKSLQELHEQGVSVVSSALRVLYCKYLLSFPLSKVLQQNFHHGHALYGCSYNWLLAFAFPMSFSFCNSTLYII